MSNTRSGMTRTPESMAKLETMYSSTYDKKVPDRTAAEEKIARKDPLYAAHKTVESLVNFFTLMAEENGFGPATMIYASELFVLNVQRAQNCPLPAEKIKLVKDRAKAYYEAGIKQLP